MTESINISRNADGELNYRENESEFNPEANAARDAEPTTSARVYNGATSVSISGSSIDAQSHGTVRTTVGAGDGADGNILATARTVSGRPLAPSEITDDSIIKIGGTETTVRVAKATGFLTEDDNGKLVMTGADPDAEPRTTSTEQAGREAELQLYEVPEVVRRVTQAAMEGLPEVVASHALYSTLLGEDVNYNQLESRSGIPADTIKANLDTAASGLVQSMASRYGLEPNQLGDLLDIADKSDGRESVKSALRGLIAGDGRSFNMLAQKAMLSVAPPEAEILAAGYETKTDPSTKKLLVKLGDVWVDAGVARRIGEI